MIRRNKKVTKFWWYYKIPRKIPKTLKVFVKIKQKYCLDSIEVSQRIDFLSDFSWSQFFINLYNLNFKLSLLTFIIDIIYNLSFLNHN